MIKAVFFDWFNTLARYEPPREELQSQVLQEFGINVPRQQVIQGLQAADRYFFGENSISPVRKRSLEEQGEIYIRYQRTLLAEAGVNPPEELGVLIKIMKRVQQLVPQMNFVLFDDVLLTMKALKERKLTQGLLTNIDKDMSLICRELGLQPYINFIVTAGQVGADKPELPIFLIALEQAGVSAAEAVHVGDQYQIDVMGARKAGMMPVLIDRYDFYPEVTDCRRIHSLSELPACLQ